MQVHVVGHSNRHLYAREMQQNFRNRHEIFVKRRGWHELARPDGLECDQFDNKTAVHLLALRHEHQAETAVLGGFRLHSFEGETLLEGVFADMVERPLPSSRDNMMDCSRFYSVLQGEGADHRGCLTALMFAGMMEYGLNEGIDYITFVTYVHFINIMAGLGIRVTPLGAPRQTDRWPSFAAYMHVSEATLADLRRAAGIERPLLVARGRALPGLHDGFSLGGHQAMEAAPHG